jgi:lysophospholipase L1-like esterase
VLVTGYWNVFEDGAVARDSFPDVGVRATRRLTRLANAAIQQDARATGATYVDLYAPFNGPVSRGDTTRLLAADGDHPNAAGQALIAQRLVAAGLPGLAEG